jgi:hypothetical protein
MEENNKPLTLKIVAWLVFIYGIIIILSILSSFLLVRDVDNRSFLESFFDHLSLIDSMLFYIGAFISLTITAIFPIILPFVLSRLIIKAKQYSYWILLVIIPMGTYLFWGDFQYININLENLCIPAVVYDEFNSPMKNWVIFENILNNISFYVSIDNIFIMMPLLIKYLFKLLAEISAVIYSLYILIRYNSNFEKRLG